MKAQNVGLKESRVKKKVEHYALGKKIGKETTKIGRLFCSAFRAKEKTYHNGILSAILVTVTLFLAMKK
jgi:hypothetical protein